MRYFRAVAYGATLPASQAAPILSYFEVGADTDIGPGYEVEYQGQIYWLLQRDTKFPSPDSTSPDGWHIVYSPSEEEKELNPPPESADIFGDILKLGGLAIGVYAGVSLLKVFKK